MLSGNSNDRQTFAASVKAYRQQLKEGEAAYLVMDSAGYSKETLNEAEGVGWLMRVPETLAQAGSG